ncbi:MAG TPA: PAS domain-containing protein [Candidatus Coprenecus stercoripullorum]|nr:PAS domain-containing protein [Candidatus Coprenecus stercoripullorum]
MSYRAIILIVAAVLLSGMSAWGFVSGLYAVGASLSLCCILALVALFREIRRNVRKLGLMVDALANNDSTVHFSGRGGDLSYRLLNESINRINDIVSQEKSRARESEKFFEAVLMKVPVGVIVVSDSGNIADCNEKALSLLGLPYLSHVSQLQQVDEHLYSVVTGSVSGSEGFSLTYCNQNGEVHLSGSISSAKTIRGVFRIVTLDDIGEELENKEQESWQRLIRVLTHEIMNTVTPISSLSETLSMMVDGSSDETLAGVKDRLSEGLAVITDSSKGLISFVNSYRSMTKIPKPEMRVVSVRQLLHDVYILMKDDMDRAGIRFSSSCDKEDLMVYADGSTVSHVRPGIVPCISVRAYSESGSDDVVIEVADNGKMISRDEQEHIFVPFFTTKATGSGIGLSVSRQIMRQHNGQLKLKHSTEEETVFSLIFH